MILLCVFFIITRGILGAECAGWMSGDKILDLVLYVFSSMWMPISINIMIEKKNRSKASSDMHADWNAGICWYYVG